MKPTCAITFNVGGDGKKVTLIFDAIPVSKIEVVYAEAQRGIIYDSRIRELSDNWDWTLCEPLTVFGPDKAGRYHVAEGNHRARVIAILFGDKQCAPCRVFPATNPREAARVFLELSKKKRITSIQSFNVAASAGYDDETKVKSIVERFGYSIGSSLTEGKVNAVGALIQCLRQYDEVGLTAAVCVIRNAFGNQRNAMAGPIVSGMCMFLAKADKPINLERLVKKLRELDGGSALLFGNIKYRKTRMGGRETITESAAREIMEIYNKGLGSNRVELT